MESAQQRILRSASIDPTSGCWLWIGAIQSAGYGNLLADGRIQLAHRVSYEAFVGPIPEGWQVHHRCHQTVCVNPEHLEALTVKAHRALSPAPESCPKGHTEWRFKSGWRDCAVCHRDRERERSRRKRHPELV